jgi:hypothetical protein
MSYSCDAARQGWLAVHPRANSVSGTPFNWSPRIAERYHSCKESVMNETQRLLQPAECGMVLVDFQAGLAFGVESTSRQVLVNNALALARTAVVFGVPVVVSTSASRVYSGPLLPSLHEVLSSVKPIERRNMNLWEDAIAREAVLAMNRKRLIVAGLLTESCVSL